MRREGLKWKDFIDQGYVIAGSPKTVRERLREAMKSLNCGHLMILMQIGSMPPELVRKSTTLFATEVMPYMRDLWSDFEDKLVAQADCPKMTSRCRPTSISRRPKQRQGASGRVGRRRRCGARNEHDSETSKRKILARDAGLWQSGEPLLYLHGAGGLMPVEPFLEDLGSALQSLCAAISRLRRVDRQRVYRRHRDAVLFYHELMDELGIPTANLVGHSMGGMLAAEVAAFDVHRAKKLVLIAPAGFWIDAVPIPDLFAAQLTEIAALLFHDPNSPAAQMMTAIPSDFKALETMYVERVKRLATASKFLWPIPDRGLKKRAYRITAPTLLLWGDDDKLIPPVYAKEFTSRIKNSKLEMIKNAGHMVMYEQQEALVGAIRNFLKG